MQPLIPKLGDDVVLTGGDMERLSTALTEPIYGPHATACGAAGDGMSPGRRMDGQDQGARASCLAMTAVGLRFAIFEPPAALPLAAP